MGKKRRLDQLVVEKGLVESRAKAQAHILAGEVSVNGQVFRKVSKVIDPTAEISFNPGGPQYVSRGGGKLAGALDHFQINPKGWFCLDVGASTSGFTDCLLQRGAAHVFAMDVGTDQLHPKIREDSHVTWKENLHISNLRPENLPQLADMAVIDVSFISLKKALPSVLACLKPGGHLLALIKPQFEVGPKDLGKSGILKNEDKRQEVIQDLSLFCTEDLELEKVACQDSVIAGQGGNQETFLLAHKPV